MLGDMAEVGNCLPTCERPLDQYLLLKNKWEREKWNEGKKERMREKKRKNINPGKDLLHHR
jgi:hypothetical protein